MISYSQNFEDVLLNRFFNGKEEGFYIDVGAFDPVFLSDTKHFYDLGWSGINIEPTPSGYEKLCEQRERDINLNIALSDKRKKRAFYVLEDVNTGSLDAGTMSSFSLASVKAAIKRYDENYSKYGRKLDYSKRMVQTDTLANVCEQYCTKPIDFLKIDVEGAEREVLLGADFKKFRPSLVIVEAKKTNTNPLRTTKRQYAGWGRFESILTEADYENVYFDGLNRFYLAREEARKKAVFSIPVCIYDKFVTVRESDCQKKIHELKWHVEEKTGALEDAKKQLADEAEKAKRKLAAARKKARSDLAKVSAELRKARAEAAARDKEISKEKKKWAEERADREKALAAVLKEQEDLGRQLEDASVQERKLEAELQSERNCRAGAEKAYVDSLAEGQRLKGRCARERRRRQSAEEMFVRTRHFAERLEADQARLRDEAERRFYIFAQVLRGERTRLRNVITGMHAYNARLRSGFRGLLAPKFVLPDIPDNIRIKDSYLFLDTDRVAEGRSAPKTDGKMPNQFFRYPDLTSMRKAEGGLRLEGVKKSSTAEHPLVSVVTSVYNGIDHLEQALESVFNQTYRNIEYIIVDAGSTDGSLELVQKHAAKLDYFISEPDSGIYEGMNKGIQLSSGKYILLLNSDDYYMPDAVERLVRKAQEEQADIVAADSYNLNAEGELLHGVSCGVSRSSWTPFAYLVCPLKHETMLVNSSLYAQMGMYDESFKVCGDWIWMAKVYDSQQYRVAILDEAVMYFRKIGVSSEPKEVEKHRQERLRGMRLFLDDIEDDDFRLLLPLQNLDEVATKLLAKYPHNRRLCAALKARDAWAYTTRVLDDFPLVLDMEKGSGSPEPFPGRYGMELVGRFPMRHDRYPDITGGRLAEGGRRLRDDRPPVVSDNPLVSIVTTVHNGAGYIEEAILSVKNQTYDNIEYIVVDAASSDGTLAVVQRHADFIDYYVSEPDSGIYSGMNKGIELCRGEYVLILNADDYYEPDAVSALVQKAIDSGKDIVFADRNVVDEKGKMLRVDVSVIDDRFFLRCTCAHESMLVARRVYEWLGMYNEENRVISDWTWMLAAKEEYAVEFLDKAVLNFRNVGVSSCDIETTVDEKFRLLRTKIHGLTREDCWLMRYPHHMTKKQASQMMEKYSENRALVMALQRFIECDIKQ